MTRLLTTSPANSSEGRQATGPVGDVPSATVVDSQGAIAAARAASTAIRHALRTLASETGRQADLRKVRLLRPLVTQAHGVLRERLEAGGSVEAYLRGRTRLADSAVVGLLHIASVAASVRGDTMIAPLAVVAVGGYGRSELAPGSDLDLLFLLPESRPPEAAAATAACIHTVVAGLWDLGFALDHAVRSSGECLELARDEHAVLAGLLDRRFLWGRIGLFAKLNAEVASLFSGPHAAHWRGAVSSALASRHHDARTLLNEPNVKRGPGGLRDLHSALCAKTLTSGRPAGLAQPALIEAHRFLWRLRCHLHLLAGRAEDRLSIALQPGVARRLGLDERHGTNASRLLHLFRHHAHNVLQAAALAKGSISAQPQ